MPLPLLWLGMAAASAYTIKALADDRKSQQKLRFSSDQAKRLADLNPYESPVATYPTEMLSTEQRVSPKLGAIVCCGIGGILDHTGIWIDDNTIIEVDGNGLVKPVSPKRFTTDRTGKGIFIACDSLGVPMASELAAQRAIEQIYQVRDYNIFENNCHQFILQCFCVNAPAITTFKALSNYIAEEFDRVVYWDICDC